MIISNRRSFLIGVGATIVAIQDTRAALIMPEKKIIRPSPVQHMIVGCPGRLHPQRIFNEVGKEVLSIAPGMLFELTCPSFDFIAYAKASGAPIVITNFHPITREKIISKFNGEIVADISERIWFIAP